MGYNVVTGKRTLDAHCRYEGHWSFKIYTERVTDPPFMQSTLRH